jgi:hypothetical protein
MTSHFVYEPISPSGRYITQGGSPSPPKSLNPVNDSSRSYDGASCIGERRKPRKQEHMSTLDRQRMNALRFSLKTAEFEMRFPTGLVFDDSELQKFKEEDLLEKRTWYSRAGKEEEKAVTAAKVLLEKEGPLIKSALLVEVTDLLLHLILILMCLYRNQQYLGYTLNIHHCRIGTLRRVIRIFIFIILMC